MSADALFPRSYVACAACSRRAAQALLLADRVCVMTARPGRIKKSIDVGIARPRAIEVTTSPEFNALRREVLALIREESEHAAMAPAGSFAEMRDGQVS